LADIVDKATRSRFMSGIRSRNTKPETRVRSALHREGIRYRLNDRRLVGAPDLVFPKYRAVLFVHGCFWHRHPGCPKATTPSSNTQFWRNKFDRNEGRDKEVRRELLALGWRVGVVWECGTKPVEMPDLVRAVGQWLAGSENEFEFPQSEPDLASNR
jgi:DNA mismatch endonuclease (patch repair protein)